MHKINKSLLVGVLSAAPLFAHSAENVELPGTLAMTAYGTGSAGYTQMVSIGNLLKNEYDTSVRILPGENDVSRMTPLRMGRVPLCACGIASYYGSEGVLLFADPDWGPQPIRLISTSTASFGLGVAVAGDTNVKTPADLKGKRVAYIRGDDALNVGTEAFLAFGGLTWDDVERVEFPGYGRAFEGIVANQVDAAFTMSVAPPAQQLAASPRGIVWPELDPADKEGWKRLQNVAPYFQPHKATSAAGEAYGKDSPWIGASYPYPILVGNKSLDDKTASSLIRVLIEDHDKYKDAAPGNAGYALENQNMQWVIPYHDAVVEYYKEIGHWTDAMQAHQDKLIKRQEILQTTWKSFLDSNPPEDEDAFRSSWMKVRAEALQAEGMAPVFR
ncbi:TAXI family TRAP transporter solute-binding subunit [Marinobacter sp. M216]|uniref:TAXI family TRAP transporter solute-binding subunit n=1 Tax=Marinobacter albus TaxID=3030833 RepID=A0ABT7H829_9GAMM|nr:MULTISPECIES: TAXI family TRAP transporter solute-binding subunit [unclassified Marinobacter]MBW7471213.1 TAXI family TRAP transporter solute-binding subunit [Marinobacter sp. F4218]MDK9556511.1 TAXI family TRAP transporter solute-binding subunit [Marinobacter sp. M216]